MGQNLWEEIMKDISITDFKKMLVSDIKKGGSFRLTADGEVIALVMLPISAERKRQLEALASQMNSAIGIT